MVVAIEKIRHTCVTEMNRHIRNKRYAQNLETQIWEYASSPNTLEQIRQSYYRKYNQILFNLKRNAKYLYEKYTPSELVLVDNLDLNPDGKNILQKHNEDMKQYYEILENQDMGGDGETGNDGLCCPKCKYTKITIIPKQTRSADEGMTIFCACNNPSCGKRWKM